MCVPHSSAAQIFASYVSVRFQPMPHLFALEIFSITVRVYVARVKIWAEVIVPPFFHPISCAHSHLSIDSIQENICSWFWICIRYFFLLLLFHCQFANESERFCIDITIDPLTLNIYRYFDWYSANDKQMANKWEHMQYKYMSSADKNRATDKNPSEKIAVLTSHTTFAMWQRFRLNINIRAMSPRYLGGYIYVRKSHHVCAWRCVR